MTELEKLVEKDAIRDQYYVYARALDRIDNPLGKTVFAEDAQVDYGPTYKGTGYGFIDMMLKMHRKMVSTHHVMTNILIKLNEYKLPGCYLHRTDPDDVARVEDRTFICCEKEEDAGPTNHLQVPQRHGRRGALPRHRPLGEARRQVARRQAHRRRRQHHDPAPRLRARL